MNTNLSIYTQINYGADSQSRARAAAAKQFERVLSQGRRSQFWGRLSGRSSTLESLNRAPVHRQSRSGIVSVPLSRIVGSEGRSDDFDAEFRPLKEYNDQRWIGIAAARRTGVTLPPVELVQVGDVYYVRDGHHRISVAKAMGQFEIDAVIV